MNKENKCVMCSKKLPEQRITNDGVSVGIHFEDPNTKELLCEKDNAINNSIYKRKGISKEGILKITKK